jgi:formylglycine-generating enzyme required for sulfatase activity
MSQLFISYAHNDAAEQSTRLYRDLEAAGHLVWRDNLLSPTRPFDYLIEKAIREASTIIVCVTQEVLEREDSFVRNEIAFALYLHKSIIPLKFSGADLLPISICRHTWIDFGDYTVGLEKLLDWLKKPGDSPPPATPPPPLSQRKRVLAYLQEIGQRFEIWRYNYTELAGRAEKEPSQPKVKVKPQVMQYLNTTNAVYQQRGFVESGEARTVETVNDLREVVRRGGVVLIGDPGSGKTTTLQRLAYEFAVEAAETLEKTPDEAVLLPLYVPLGAYNGGGLEKHFAAYWIPSLAADLSKQVVLLLDGLNEMPREYTSEVDAWLRAHPDARVVVSCRKLDYAALQALPLRRVDVLPLDVERIHEFIGNFFEDADRDRLFWALAGDAAELWQRWQAADLSFENFWEGEDLQSGHPAYSHTSPGQDSRYNALRAALRERGELPGLLGLVSNPFLLKITIEVFVTSGQPPANRGQLFAAFVDLLIEKRGRLSVSAAHPWIEPDVQRRALSRLAYQMQAEGMGTSVPLAWAKATWTKDHLVPDRDNLLYLAESATLLMRDTANNEIKFFHQLLQEYFAALRLGELIVEAHGRAPLPASDVWKNGQWWQRTAWEETAVLLAGMQPGVARWLIDAHPVLACRALTEGLPDSSMIDSVRAALFKAMIENAPAAARAEAGRIINRIGDPRKGIGVVVGAHGRAPLPDIEWCSVPAGPFLYGDDKKKTTIPYNYAISKYPVTNAQFQAFIDAPDGYNRREWWTDAGWEWKGERAAPDEYADPLFRLPNHPRISVRWYEAVAFCNWLTAQVHPAAWEEFVGATRRVAPTRPPNAIKGLIRLPTEQEWEKAARGSDGRVYPWGNEFDAAKCNSSVGDQPIGMTSAVGIFPAGASPCGALDMSGNVWEWCLTAYKDGNNDINRTDARVLRGGSWDNDITDNFCVAARYGNNPYSGGNYWGFRLVRSENSPGL